MMIFDSLLLVKKSIEPLLPFWYAWITGNHQNERNGEKERRYKKGGKSTRMAFFKGCN